MFCQGDSVDGARESELMHFDNAKTKEQDGPKLRSDYGLISEKDERWGFDDNQWLQ